MSYSHSNFLIKDLVKAYRIKFPSFLLYGAILGAITFAPYIYASSSLSREEIMRQHQALEREHNGDDGVSSESLAAPAGSDSDSSEERGNTQGATTKSSKTDNNLTAQLLERVSALEGQVRQLRGDVDSLTNKQQQDEANTTKQFGDMQFALENGASGGAGAAHTAIPEKTATKTEVVSKTTQPQTALEAIHQARAALKAHQYPEAEKLSRYALANAHSVSGKTESHYLLATSLAGEKQYHESATEYYDIYSKEPKSSYASDALLGLSYSLLNAGSKSAACEALAKLGKEYPSSSANNSARAKAISNKAACHH